MIYDKNSYRAAKQMQKRLDLDYYYISNDFDGVVDSYNKLANKDSYSIFKRKIGNHYFIVKKETNDYKKFESNYLLIDINS